MIGRELDDFWKTVVNAIRDGIMIVNTGGAIVSVNRAFEQISGYSREELIGQTEKILNCEFSQSNSPAEPAGSAAFAGRDKKTLSINAGSGKKTAPTFMR